MAVFIEARTEPFEEQRQQMANDIRANGRGDFLGRRPVRGFQLKEDTYAIIRVMGPDGRFMEVIDAAGETFSTQVNANVTSFYSNFFIQSIVEQRQEKQQIVETFGDSWIFFFGEAPRLIKAQGYLLNTADFNWRAEFWENYDRYFRGTRLVELGARLYLMYDDIILEGYMLNAAAQESAAPNKEVIQFSFEMFLTGYTNVSRLGDPDFPAPTDLDYAQLSSYDTAIQNWQRSRNLQRELSTQAVSESNKRAYQMGVGHLMADTLRSNIINAGDPSISSFVSRAMLATQSISRAVGANENRSSTNAFQPEMSREIPLRGQFSDNLDEFIGGSSRLTAEELASPLSMAERWLEMDRQMDSGLDGMTSGGADAAGQAFWDTMGRAGRAQQEIMNSGGTRLLSQNINRGMLIGTASRAGNQASMMRSIPFGMSIAEGEML